MKIRFIEWFVSLFLKGMKEFRYDETEKEKMYEQIISSENTNKKSEKKI